MHQFVMIMSRCLRTLPQSVLFTTFFAALLIPALPHDSLAYSITKTGISLCYNDGKAPIDCPSPGQDFYGQDGTYRMGKTMSYAVGVDTVEDKVTGLIWQASYSDYISNRDAAYSYCENLNLDGRTDWRLPTRKELLSITDDGRVDPAINPAFPCAPEWYWTVTQDNNLPARQTYAVNFSNGQLFRAGDMTHVRCVRGGAIPESTYVVSPDGLTVEDTTTGLVWERAGSDDFMNWKDAMAWCEARDTGGKTDWRLPNKKELEILIWDGGAYPLYIPPGFIEPSVGRRYWSGSAFAGPREESWVVQFDFATTVYIGNLRVARYYVRCVRGGGQTGGSSLPANTILLFEN